MVGLIKSRVMLILLNVPMHMLTCVILVRVLQKRITGDREHF
jgi:hypothetical protein